MPINSAIPVVLESPNRAVEDLATVPNAFVQPANGPWSDYGHELLSVTASIREPLAQVELLMQERLSSRHADVELLLKHVREMGGKRLRPALVLLSANAEGYITEESIRLATAIELVHTATLVHDDILDEANTRRHRPTLHCRSNVHDSILIGDRLFTEAYGLANEGESTIPGRWIARAAKEVCEGEICQNLSIGQLSLTIDDYFLMLGQKTGSLCAISCALGAWSAGGTEQHCEAFHEFGWKLGTAFQVHDDYLDYWGLGERLGKAIGMDFAAGKLTLPIIRILQIAKPSERQELIDDLRLRDGAALNRVKSLLDRYRVGEYCRDAAIRLSHDAIDVCDPFVQVLDEIA